MPSPVPGRRAAALLPIPLAVLLVSPFVGVTVAQPWHVEGHSMEPGIEHGSVILVDALGPRLTGYERGDIVVLSAPPWATDQAPVLVKRIVGLPGDHVLIEHGALRVNGQPADEPYLGAGTVTLLARMPGGRLEVTVPPGAVFVMGDQRENSFDSKAFGPIPLESLVGRVWLALEPDGRVGLAPAAATGR